jgi:hypothetical protein
MDIVQNILIGAIIVVLIGMVIEINRRLTAIGKALEQMSGINRILLDESVEINKLIDEMFRTLGGESAPQSGPPRPVRGREKESAACALPGK